MKLYKRENILSRIRGFYLHQDMIKVITGIRRCGKSSIMKLISEELMTSYNVPESNIIFIDLNKRPNKRIKTDDELEKLIESKTQGISGIKHIFIDEIQNVKDFEPVIEAFRLEEEYNFFITGSNSYLLSGELVTKLTGRYIEFEMGTLTFDEYLDMKKFYKIEVGNQRDEFDKYILDGGFPKTIFMSTSEERAKYANEVINDIFIKDIKKKHKIRNLHLFEQVKRYIINNFGATISVPSLAQNLSKANKMKVSVQTVYNYIDLLEKAKIINKCLRFDLKSKRSLNGEEKYYLSDLSFYFAAQTDNLINYGQCLENIVYNYARNKDYQISIGKIGKFECDFILRNLLLREYSYVQVCFLMIGNQDTEDREYRPLEMIKDNYPKYILSLDSFIQRRNGIIHANAFDFMSEGRKF